MRKENRGRGKEMNILQRRQRLYKVVKPRSFLCGWLGGCESLTEQSFSKFIIRGDGRCERGGSLAT